MVLLDESGEGSPYAVRIEALVVRSKPIASESFLRDQLSLNYGSFIWPDKECALFKAWSQSSFGRCRLVLKVGQNQSFVRFPHRRGRWNLSC